MGSPKTLLDFFEVSIPPPPRKPKKRAKKVKTLLPPEIPNPIEDIQEVVATITENITEVVENITEAVSQVIPEFPNIIPEPLFDTEVTQKNVVMAFKTNPDNTRTITVQDKDWIRDEIKEDPLEFSFEDTGEGDMDLVYRNGKYYMQVNRDRWMEKDRFREYLNAMHLGEGEFAGKQLGYRINEDKLGEVLAALEQKNFEVAVPELTQERVTQVLSTSPMTVKSNEVVINVTGDSKYVTLSGGLADEIGEYMYDKTTIKRKEWRVDPQTKRRSQQLVEYRVVYKDNYRPNTWQTYPALLRDFLPELAEKFNARIVVNDTRDYSVGDPIPITTDEYFSGFRPYQQEAIDKALMRGSGLISIATGGGKTEVGIGIIGNIGKDAVWLTHKSDLVEQTEERAESRLNMDVGTFYGGEDKLVDNPGMDMNVLSIQGINDATDRLNDHHKAEEILELHQAGRKRLSEKEKRKYEKQLLSPEKLQAYANLFETIDKANVMIIDEAHHLKAETFKKSWLSNPKIARKYGLTATPFNRDNVHEQKVRGIIGSPIVRVTASELIQKKYLAKPDIKMIHMPYARSEELDAMPDVIRGQSAGKWFQVMVKEAIVRNKTLTNTIARLTKKQFNQNKNALILVDLAEHGQHIKDELVALGVPESEVKLNMREIPKLDAKGNMQFKMVKKKPKLVKQTKPKSYTRNLLDKFRAGKFKVMIATVGIAGEGTDIPKVDNVIIGDGGKSYIETMQKIGRGLRRPDPSKKSVRVFDFAFDNKWLVDHANERLDIYQSEPEFMVEQIDLDTALSKYT